MASSNSHFTNGIFVATTSPTRKKQDHLQFNFCEQEQCSLSQKQKKVRIEKTMQSNAGTPQQHIATIRPAKEAMLATVSKDFVDTRTN